MPSVYLASVRMSGCTQTDQPQNTPAIEDQQTSNADRATDEDRTARWSEFLIEHLLAGARGPSDSPHVPPTREDMGAHFSPNLRSWLVGSAVNPTATATSFAACASGNGAAISNRHLQQHEHERQQVHSHLYHHQRNGFAIPIQQQQSSNRSFVSSPVAGPAHSGSGQCGKSGSIATLVGTTSNTAGVRKKCRTTFSGRQVFELERHFAVKKYLSSTERAVLAHSLEMYEHSLIMSIRMCTFSRLCHYVSMCL